MDNAQLLRLARVGAEARLSELQAEMDAIRRQFPNLARRDTSKADGRGRAVKPRRKRRMSAAARKRISDAQKARWAKQKAKQQRAAPARGGSRKRK